MGITVAHFYIVETTTCKLSVATLLCGGCVWVSGVVTSAEVRESRHSGFSDVLLRVGKVLIDDPLPHLQHRGRRRMVDLWWRGEREATNAHLFNKP